MPIEPPDQPTLVNRAQSFASLAIALVRVEKQLCGLVPSLDPAVSAELGAQIAAARRELDWLRKNRAVPAAGETGPFWRKLLPPD